MLCCSAQSSRSVRMSARMETPSSFALAEARSHRGTGILSSRYRRWPAGLGLNAVEYPRLRFAIVWPFVHLRQQTISTQTLDQDASEVGTGRFVVGSGGSLRGFRNNLRHSEGQSGL